MEGYENTDPNVDELLGKLGLVEGAEIKLVKVVDDGVSEIKAGAELSGTLDFDVAVGKRVSLNEGAANTTSIQHIDEHEGRVYLKTRTSVYELVQSETNTETQEEIKKPKSVTTARGSKYTYLEDGRTQRFKEATGEMHDPQDLLVFIPPWDKIGEQAVKMFPDIFKGIDNQVQFEQVILEFGQGKGKTMRPVNEQGKVLTSLEDVAEDERVFIAFVDKNENKAVFHLPVSKEPQIGWNTFDTRLYKDEDGNTVRERHIGNAVTDIEY